MIGLGRQRPSAAGGSGLRGAQKTWLVWDVGGEVRSVDRTET